jgi:cytidylate kinase
MSVLLISRGSMSGGQIIAECLSHTVGFRCVTREDLIALVNQHGEIATRVTDSIEKAATDYERFSELRRPYKILMRLALLEYARQDNLAYFGYSGHLLLEAISHFVKIRLLAPVELRVKTTIERLRCNETEAQDYIRRVDEERTQWARFMYGKNIQDPRLYDLCINMEKISFSAVCSLLQRVLQEKEFRPTEESLAKMEEMYVAAQVEGTLATHPNTHAYEIGASFHKGKLQLQGPYLDDPEKSLVLELAGSVGGVQAVEYEPGYAPDLEFLP